MALTIRQAAVLAAFVAAIIGAVFISEHLRAEVLEAGWLLHGCWIGFTMLSACSICARAFGRLRRSRSQRARL